MKRSNTSSFKKPTVQKAAGITNDPFGSTLLKKRYSKLNLDKKLVSDLRKELGVSSRSSLANNLRKELGLSSSSASSSKRHLLPHSTRSLKSIQHRTTYSGNSSNMKPSSSRRSFTYKAA